MKKLFSILPVVILAVVLVSTVAASRKPINLYLIGDSTLAECTADSTACGWGHALPTYLHDEVLVKNCAQAGASSKSFVASGAWENVTNQLHRGDVVLIQFAHNDEQESDPKIYSSIVDFEHNLQELIKQAKKKKAKVILCTPIARRAFNEHLEQLADTHGAYPKAVRRVVEATGTPLLDLTAITMQWLSTTDKELSATYYADEVCLTPAGATEVARLAAEEIQKQEIKCLAPYVKLAE